MPGPPIVRSMRPEICRTASRNDSASSRPTIHPPEQAIFRVDGQRVAEFRRRSCIRDARCTSLTAESTDAVASANLWASSRNQHGQPVEQFGVRRRVRPSAQSRSACRRARDRSDSDQTRLTTLRHVSGLSGAASQSARAARRAASSFGSSKSNRPGNAVMADSAPGTATRPVCRMSPRRSTWTTLGVMRAVEFLPVRIASSTRRTRTVGGQAWRVASRRTRGRAYAAIGGLLLLRPLLAWQPEARIEPVRAGLSATAPEASVAYSFRRPIRCPPPCSCFEYNNDWLAAASVRGSSSSKMA